MIVPRDIYNGISLSEINSVNTHPSAQLRPCSVTEEDHLLCLIERCYQQGCLTAAERRLRCRLLLRQKRRQLKQSSVKPFNLDIFYCKDITHITDESAGLLNDGQTHQLNIDRCLDRYLTSGSASSTIENMVYNHPQLPKYIFRDWELPSKVPRVCLHEELLRKINHDDCTAMQPLDFLPVQQRHISSMNRAARTFFWSHLDLSEALRYPRHSAVACYRDLLVGFVVVVPAYENQPEAYLSFLWVHTDWRRVGVASRLLYHAIQSCPAHDLTLHCAVDSLAVLLYNRFGFKPERFIQGFYDKYLPQNASSSRNAFFMRLKR